MTEARRFAAPFTELWVTARMSPDAPLFSGGMLDAWPALHAHGVSLMLAEEQSVRELVREEARDDG